ncbi:peptidoglycan-binding protein [Streptomyces sp. NPDC001380]|uniref:peptidoglycan-binding protein n=1 Tax=Streptomyces sp. NPDC001380 TaxID=3364566 RepID=UPI0036B705B0
METPTFRDVPSAEGCLCPACSATRLAHDVRRLRRAGTGGGQGHAPLRPLVAVAAAGTALTAAGAAHAAPADAPARPAAGLPSAADLPAAGGPVRTVALTAGAPAVRTAAGARTAAAATGTAAAPGGRPARRSGRARTDVRELTRAEIVARAARWLDRRIPYSQSRYRDGYRTDCSGFISMAWDLPDSAWTGNLADFAERIPKRELAAGDILLFHNARHPVRGSHVVLFDHWADRSHRAYVGYEQAPPHTLRRTIPYGYFTHSGQYRAYRYRYLVQGSSEETPFPGEDSFRPGATNDAVSTLGSLLVARGGGRFYDDGPGPDWGFPDREATRAFQRAQGWRGAAADGYPGPETWRLLVEGGGADIPHADGYGYGYRSLPAAGGTRAFPGAGAFRPGRIGGGILELGRRLVARGYGGRYRVGPNRVWTEADRLNVRDFQRAQGWRGAAADGYPGPETWERLFDRQ